MVEDLGSWPGCQAFAREDIPPRLGYGRHRLALDLLLLCAANTSVAADGTFPDSWVPDPPPADSCKHGWDS